mmetsp:Transcript_53902/g.66062  ORF Transcript_53902/g.66062 Transcript_53902/m.66062 type:complete len:308 (+) Transcript_53902:32-955(+)
MTDIPTTTASGGTTDNDSNGLNKSEKIAIFVIAGVVGCLLLIGFIIWIDYRCRKKRTSRPSFGIKRFGTIIIGSMRTRTTVTNLHNTISKDNVTLSNDDNKSTYDDEIDEIITLSNEVETLRKTIVSQKKSLHDLNIDDHDIKMDIHIKDDNNDVKQTEIVTIGDDDDDEQESKHKNNAIKKVVTIGGDDNIETINDIPNDSGNRNKNGSKIVTIEENVDVDVKDSDAKVEIGGGMFGDINFKKRKEFYDFMERYQLTDEYTIFVSYGIDSINKFTELGEDDILQMGMDKDKCKYIIELIQRNTEGI